MSISKYSETPFPVRMHMIHPTSLVSSACFEQREKREESGAYSICKFFKRRLARPSMHMLVAIDFVFLVKNKTAPLVAVIRRQKPKPLL